MCGIAGVIRCGDLAALERMTGSIVHRGPDDHGIEWFGDHGSGLGHRRLSIIDLSPAGHQPMASEDGRFRIVFNGEIYNYRDIREELESAGHRFRSSSDTEVLLNCYLQWGQECLPRLNGMFAFAIFDTASGDLFVARDRLGVKPLYYWHNGPSLVFASEIKAILASGLVPRAPDIDALHTPARFQIAPHTGFKGIMKLGAGACFVLRGGELVVRRYWSLEPTEDLRIKEAEAVERLDSLLADSVRLQMIADVPVGLFLSGGLDSSIIAAFARRNTSQEIHSFTIKFSDDDQKFEKMPRDEVYARLVAQHLNLRYHEFEIKPDVVDLLPRLVWHLDEPLSDPAAINLFIMSKAARDLGIVVMLNGMGGDEVFGGYRKHLACLKAETYQHIMPLMIRRAIEQMVDSMPIAHSRGGWRTLRWSKRFLSFASKPPVERFLNADLSMSATQMRHMFLSRPEYSDSHFYRAQANTLARNDISYLTRMCLNDTQVFLPEHNLMYSDKACMAAGIEGRPPLTDHRVIEWMFTMPAWCRIKGNDQKHLLKRVAERYLSKEVIYRPKAPFASPLRAWIRGQLAEMVSDLLSEESIRRRGLYDPAYVTGLIARDRAGREDNSYIIWTLLNVETWFRTFFSNI